MVHGDADDVVGLGDGFLGETVALGAHDDGQAWLGHERGVVDGYGMVGQRHGGRAEAVVVERWQGSVYPRPVHQEDGTHGHTDAATVERVARVAREQYAVDAQRCRRPEDGANIGGVDHTIDDHDAAGIAAYRLYAAFGRSAHGTEHASCQCVARELSQQRAVAGIDGYVATLGDDVGGIAGDVLALAEQCHGLTALCECHTDDLGTLGVEDGTRRIQSVTQLCLGERAEQLYSRLT